MVKNVECKSDRYFATRLKTEMIRFKIINHFSKQL